MEKHHPRYISSSNGRNAQLTTLQDNIEAMVVEIT
jgi:hypothetical protein